MAMSSAMLASAVVPVADACPVVPSLRVLITTRSNAGACLDCGSCADSCPMSAISQG